MYLNYLILLIHAFRINQVKREIIGGVNVFPYYFYTRMILIFFYLIRPSIRRFLTIFPKYLLKIFTNLPSSETTLLFSTKLILSKFYLFTILSVYESFTVFQKSFIFGNVFYIEVIVKFLFSLS